MSDRVRFAFANRHPWVLFLYFAGMIGITAVTMHPMLIGISFFISIFYSTRIRGAKTLKEMAAMGITVFLFACIIQPLFSHNGMTPIFYLNGQAVTWETICFGLVMGILFLTVYVWFTVWNIWITNDKFLYVFYRPFSKAALLLSMVLRMVPQLRQRFARIDEAWRGMGRDYRTQKFPDNIRILTAELSVLLSWSLESSLDTSDSMEARGYGLGKRTGFHLFRFKMRDAIWTAVLLVCYGVCIIFMAGGEYRMYYFPAIYMKKITVPFIAGALGFLAAGMVPLGYQWIERMEYHGNTSV